MMQAEQVTWISRIAAVLMLAAAGGVSAGNCPADVANLPAGQWCEVPNSNMSSVAFNWPPGVTFTENGVGVEGVMSLWSGGAYDSRRDRLVVWGGGHEGYAGNEIYAFDVNTLKWTRVTDPSIPVAYNSAYAPDGAPGSRHTYDSLEYIPTSDRFCSFVDGSDYPSGSTSGKGQLNAFNFDTNSWERKAVTPGGSSIADTIGVKSAFDPVANLVYVLGGPHGPFASYNPASNSWKIHVSFISWIEYSATAAIDPKRRKMVVMGAGDQWVFDLQNPGAGHTALSSSGGATIINANGPGVDYDPVSDRIVAWSGGADVYVLNMDTLIWSRVSPSASNTTVPTAAQSAGTFGRFRYVPSKNVFVAVNSINGNVYFYKLTDGALPPPPQAPAKPSVVIR